MANWIFLLLKYLKLVWFSLRLTVTSLCSKADLFLKVFTIFNALQKSRSPWPLRLTLLMELVRELNRNETENRKGKWEEIKRMIFLKEEEEENKGMHAVHMKQKMDWKGAHCITCSPSQVDLDSWSEAQPQWWQWWNDSNWNIHHEKCSEFFKMSVHWPLQGSLFQCVPHKDEICTV